MSFCCRRHNFLKGSSNVKKKNVTKTLKNWSHYCVLNLLFRWYHLVLCYEEEALNTNFSQPHFSTIAKFFSSSIINFDFAKDNDSYILFCSHDFPNCQLLGLYWETTFIVFWPQVFHSQLLCFNSSHNCCQTLMHKWAIWGAC